MQASVQPTAINDTPVSLAGKIEHLISKIFDGLLPTTGLRDLRKRFPKATLFPRAYFGPFHLSLNGAGKGDLVASSSRSSDCNSGKAESRILATIQLRDAHDFCGVIIIYSSFACRGAAQVFWV